jgi:glycosyltransferase involved in cell wall biosynthesis
VKKASVQEQITHVATKPHFAIAVLMAGGNITTFLNLKEKIGQRNDIDSSWLPIELESEGFVARNLPRLYNGALANTFETRSRIRALERSGVTLSAAYIIHHSLVAFSRQGLGHRIPFLLGMDTTPLYCLERGFTYAHPVFDPNTFVSRAKHRMVCSALKKAFHLLPLSYGVKESLIEHYGMPAEKITVMPPGINVDEWSVPSRIVSSDSGRERPIRILFVGLDFERKGGNMLLSLAQRPEFQNTEFHFVCGSAIPSQSKNVFIHSNVEPNTERLISLYRDADIFALPTSADTHSLVSLEAMAVGLPVISTRVGGIVDVIEDGKTGYLIEPKDIDALADRIRQLVGSYSLRREMGLAGRKRVERHFNIDVISEKVVDLLMQASFRKQHRSLYATFNN